jgi:hypothetical protein
VSATAGPNTFVREIYEGFQRVEFDRWDGVIAEDVAWKREEVAPPEGGAIFLTCPAPTMEMDERHEALVAGSRNRKRRSQ